MKEKRTIRMELGVVFGLAICCLVLAGISAPAQTEPQTKEQLETLIYSVKGPDLFQAHCAACHGLDGKGNGPMAPALKAKVPDLTVLARKNKGQFPTDRVQKVILGGETSASHGSRQMPVWGPIFHQIENDQDFGNVRVANLTKYLESIQQK